MSHRVRWPHKLPDVLAIPVGNDGHVALVDEADFWWLSDVRWYATTHGRTTYAHTNPRSPITMHRVLLAPPNGLVVDHINGDGLDNRRSNLRLCTHSQNRANSRKWTSQTSRYKGVSVCSSGVIATCNRVQLGTFDTEECAARAYDKAARALWGEFARLNFPRRGERSALEVSAA